MRKKKHMPVDPSIIAAGVAAAAQIGGQAYNAYSVGKTNLKSRQFAESMYQWQRNDALADWDRINKYNSPTEQMKRLKEAGLNPNLIYGSGNAMPVASQVRSSSPGSYQPHAPQVDPSAVGDVIGRYFDVKMKQAQYDNLLATKENIEANTRATLINAGLKDIDLKVESKLYDMGARDSEGLSRTQSVATKAALLHNDLEYQEAIKSNTVTEAAERITQIRLQQAKTQAETDNIRAALQKIQADGTLRKLDVEFAQKLNKRWDGYILRLLGGILK